MRFGQIHHNGAICAAIFENGKARPIPNCHLVGLVMHPGFERHAGEALDDFELALPIHPPEVWGCGCTYETSASFRDAEHGTREGMYAYVYREARPEVFFKGTARVCTGPGAPIGIRCDSHFTAPEPELALVLGEGGQDRGLYARQRRLGLGHRTRKRALPHAVQGVRPVLRARPGDRHARTRSATSTRWK